LVLSFLRDWKVPFKVLEGGKGGKFMDLLLAKCKNLCLSKKLDVLGVSGFLPAETTTHGGRSMLEYQEPHPEEDHAIHVVV
jgi:hypothetical protein